MFGVIVVGGVFEIDELEVVDVVVEMEMEVMFFCDFFFGGGFFFIGECCLIWC